MKISKLDLYMQGGNAERYQNTEKETQLVNKFYYLYNLAKTAQENNEDASPENLEKWRKAYLGTLGALTQEGKESKKSSRSLRKMVYELIESKIDNTVPLPKMQARYKTDLPVVGITENYLRYEAERICTKYLNDRSERSVYVDGTGWYKVWWDSEDNTHERSGDVRLEFCTVDQVYPQPGVDDYRELEYIFERQNVSISRVYEMYGRLLEPVRQDSNVVEIVNCYYLNDDGVVGLFSWCPTSLQVICNEESWQIRKVRKCTHCATTVPQDKVCPVCGSRNFRWDNAEQEILEEDLMEVYNPYEVGETEDPEAAPQAKVFLQAGSEVPFYQVRQLPFVPRPAISSMNGLYGMSEARCILDMQDAINKLYTKALDKTLKSGTVVTKPEKMKISDNDETFKIFGVRSPEEATMVQAKQIVADTSQDILLSNTLYESGRSSSGVTNSFQGKNDTTATSGKAKQYSALQSAGRMESLRVMKSAAFAGVYELVFKYLLAFSDEPRTFVRVLPDGTENEQCWSKYMFLSKDKHGQVYYRDDFAFSCDGASTLGANREAMWQETSEQFLRGTFGVPTDPRALELYWNIMDSFQYPLAKVVLTGIKENSQHLPPALEQAIMQNPELMAMIQQMAEEQQGGHGGGNQPNGFTHAANVEKTNIKGRDNQKQEAFTPQSDNATTIGQVGDLQ